MKSFEPGRLPALHLLAREFALCDNWYSEVPGPTMPNRCYMHAATSAGFVHNVWNHDFDVPTIYNRLEDAGKTWGCYFSDQNDLSQYTRINSKKENFKHIDLFAADARAGRLPNYSFLVPQFLSSHDGQPVNSMHAPQDVRPGDVLVAGIYEALRANQEAWAKTLFVITFDEHGGFFDHVAPPEAPNPDGINSPCPEDSATYPLPVFDFSRLGLRVPALLISPLIKKGTVVTQRLQHTSVHATLRELWGTKPLTKRDESAASFLKVLAGPMRNDTPKTLTRPGATDGALAHASLHEYDPNHPSNQPIDATQQDIVMGWRKRMKRDLPHLQQPAAIRTQGEAHEFIRTSAYAHAARHSSHASHDEIQGEASFGRGT